MNKTITLPLMTCERCDYEWVPLVKDPIYCPFCHAPRHPYEVSPVRPRRRRL